MLRRHVQADRITEEEARTALRAARVLINHRYPHTGGLADVAWSLRESIGYYHALYAALAATLRIPLLTCNARLSRAPGLPCRVELV